MNLVLCDDHLMFVEALAFVFEARGWNVVARTVSIAEAAHSMTQHDVDVCLLDLRFPEESGLDGLDRLLRLSPRSKVVVVSAVADRATVAKALASGASGFVSKTQQLEQIVQAVTRVAAGELIVESTADGGLGAGARESTLSALDDLTPRELQVLRGLVAGHSPTALAGELGISYATARSHVQRVIMKLGVHSQLEAVVYATSHGSWI